MSQPIPDFTTNPFFNLQDQWIQTNPNELTHYFDEGAGMPVLMLHGSGLATSAAGTWWLNIPTLSQHVRTIAFDFIGYGETITAEDSEFGIRAWGEHTIRLMDALEIDKTWLMGSSLGGWVALQLAIDYPERIYGVISVGTGGAKPQKLSSTSNTADHANAENTAATKAVKRPTPPPLTPERIRQDLQKNIQKESLICDTLVDLRYQAALLELEKGLRPTLLAARDRDRYQLPLDLNTLARTQLPVLLIHGVNDKVVPLSRTLELVTAIPTADAHLFSACGHWPHITKAEEFNQLIGHYLTANSLMSNSIPST